MTTPNDGFAEITHRELGLRRQLTSGQMSMIAIGGAIGTGLFMGSAYAIGYRRAQRAARVTPSER